jgi:hypothetical protein
MVHGSNGSAEQKFFQKGSQLATQAGRCASTINGISQSRPWQASIGSVRMRARKERILHIAFLDETHDSSSRSLADLTGARLERSLEG